MQEDSGVPCLFLHVAKPARQAKQRKLQWTPVFRERKPGPREAKLLAPGYTGIGKNTNTLPTVFVFLCKYDKGISSSRAVWAGPLVG